VEQVTRGAHAEVVEAIHVKLARNQFRCRVTGVGASTFHRAIIRRSLQIGVRGPRSR
jgi:hypothetical protein